MFKTLFLYRITNKLPEYCKFHKPVLYSPKLIVMEFILMDIRADDAFLTSRNLTILIVAALVAIAVITAVFIWRKRKNKKQ